MGAFDGELYQLGYRFYEPKQERLAPTPSPREEVVRRMHVAAMPCPGSCGSVCPNHYCACHTGEEYDWVTSHCVRNSLPLRESEKFKATHMIKENSND